MTTPNKVNLIELEAEPTTWQTEDEIAFCRELYRKKNLIALVNYRRLLPHRDFGGAGMHVDRYLVNMALTSLIEALESEIL